MTAPLKILLADDQVPWPTDAENERTKAEIRREFAIAKPQIDVDVAFHADYVWFSGLLAYLEQTKGERVVRARTFEEARKHLEDPGDLDVAIVDLSWWGDYKLPRGASKRHNRGLELLGDAAGASRSVIPVVSLSQEFRTDFELMSTVLERGALPIPKNYEYPELGYRALYAAVQYLTRNRKRFLSKVQLFVSHAHEDRDLARRWVRAIETGLNVPTDAIRCTSVPGYDFSPGTDFIQALKEELAGARCVMGLWTPNSLKSQWCLFELGAAWGLAQKTLFLSLGGEALRDPPAGFRAIQASEMDDAGQRRRCLAELGRITRWKTRNRDAAESELDDLAEFAKHRLKG